MNKIYDTLIAEYIQNPWIEINDLNLFIWKYFEHKPFFYQKKDLDNLNLEQKSDIMCEKLYFINKLYNLQKTNNIYKDDVLNKIELPLLKVLKKMELTWVKIDLDKLQEIKKILQSEIQKETQIIFNITNEKFNINSPLQVGNILFNKMWIKPTKKIKTWYSVWVEVLEELSKEHKIAKHILNYRNYQKLLSTYVEWLENIINKNTNTIHTTYNQTITKTWRLSSTNPNLQNIPSASSWFSSLIKEMFIPFEKDDFIMCFDYSQIEVRILAILSKDENMLWSFKNWVDIH